MSILHIPLHHAEVVATPDKVKRWAEVSLPKKAAQARAGNVDIWGTLTFAEGYLFHSHRLGIPADHETRAALQFILQCMNAQLVAELGMTEDVRVPFFGEMITQKVFRDTSRARQAWVKGAYTSLLAGAEEFRSFLCGNAAFHDLMISDDVYNEFNQGHFAFLGALEEEGAAWEFKRALKVLRQVPPAYRVLHDIYFPVWGPVVEKDQAAFDQALEEAIRAHQYYWSNPAPLADDQANDPNGHFNPYLAAIMVHARRVGLSINCRSDYTPTTLWERDWQTDLETRLPFYF